MLEVVKQQTPETRQRIFNHDSFMYKIDLKTVYQPIKTTLKPHKPFLQMMWYL